ncbi:MAG TPA: hypothetical protein VN689_11890 [Burkholderiales bacterium]|nr:hypothetical protein [Burkholderiales bacterium]
MRRAEIEELYNERFFRMWQFYLAGAIATFHHDGNCNFQLQLARRRDAVPLTRDYIGIAESRLSDRFETAGRKEQPDLSSLSADCYSPNG